MTTALRTLIDLNPVLDVFHKREPFYPTSALVLAAAEAGRIQGYIAAHSVTTLYYLLAKHRSAAEAKAAIGDLIRFLQVAAVNQSVIDQALVIEMADFEDAVQAAAAVAVGADYVITRNVADFKRSPVKAILPAELLTLI